MIKAGDIVATKYDAKIRCLVVDVITSPSPSGGNITTSASAIRLVDPVNNSYDVLDISTSRNYHYSIGTADLTFYPKQKILFKSSKNNGSNLQGRLVLNKVGELFYAYDFSDVNKVAYAFNIKTKKLSRINYFDLNNQYESAPDSFRYIYQPEP